MTVQFDSVGRGRGDSFLKSIDARKHKLSLRTNVILAHISQTQIGIYSDLYLPDFYAKMVDLTNIVLEGFARAGMHIRLGIIRIQQTDPALDAPLTIPTGASLPEGTVYTDFNFSPRPTTDLIEWPQVSWQVKTLEADWISAFEAIKLGFPFGYNINSAFAFYYVWDGSDETARNAFSTTFDANVYDGISPPWDFSASAFSKFLGVNIADLNSEFPAGVLLPGGGYLRDTYGETHILRSNGDSLSDVGRNQDEWNLRAHANRPLTAPRPTLNDFFWTWSQLWADLRYNMETVGDAYLPAPQNLVATPTATPGEVQLNFESGLYTEINHAVYAAPFAVIYSDDPAKMNHAQATKVIGIQTGHTLTGLTTGVQYYFAVISIQVTFIYDERPILNNFTSGVSFNNGPLSNVATAIPA